MRILGAVGGGGLVAGGALAGRRPPKSKLKKNIYITDFLIFAILYV
jgi:hypothetical protein